MFSIEIKDCNFKSMRKSPQIPIALIPVMWLLIFGILSTHAQNETNSTDLLLAPLPELLVGENGNIISEASDWEQYRRDEILELFKDHVYGRVADSEVSITHHVKFMDRNALGGKAVMKEVELVVSNGSEGANTPKASWLFSLRPVSEYWPTVIESVFDIVEERRIWGKI